MWKIFTTVEAAQAYCDAGTGDEWVILNDGGEE